MKTYSDGVAPADLDTRNFRATFKIENPDAVQCSLTASMTLAEWKQLRQALIETPRSSPVQFSFWGAIDRLVESAEKQFETTRPAA